MSDEPFEILCPCCAATLVVDRSTGEVLWHRQKETKGAARSLDEMVRGLDAQRNEREKRLERELVSQRDRARLLEERFREAVSRADKSDTKPPFNPFDLD